MLRAPLVPWQQHNEIYASFQSTVDLALDFIWQSNKSEAMVYME